MLVARCIDHWRCNIVIICKLTYVLIYSFYSIFHPNDPFCAFKINIHFRQIPGRNLQYQSSVFLRGSHIICYRPLFSNDISKLPPNRLVLMCNRQIFYNRWRFLHLLMKKPGKSATVPPLPPGKNGILGLVHRKTYTAGHTSSSKKLAKYIINIVEFLGSSSTKKWHPATLFFHIILLPFCRIT